jgi:hypothetical protein
MILLKCSRHKRTEIKWLNLTTINQLVMSKNVRCCHNGTGLQYVGKRQKLTICVIKCSIFQNFIIMENKENNRIELYVGMNCTLA